MRTLRTQLTFHWHNHRKRLLWFGAIVLFLDFWLIAGYGIYEPQNAIALVMNNNFAAISIFILLTAYITAASSFPLLMGLGWTRKQYYLSSLIYFAAFSIAVSLAQTLLIAALRQLLPLITFDPGTAVTSYGMLWYSQTAVFFLLAMLFFLTSTLMFRFGLFWGVGLIVVYILSLDALRTKNPTLIDATAKTLVDILPPHFAIAISIAAAIICWWLYRSADVKSS
ncbi:DUF4052 family protein [Paenibacillus woosongensis]|uniref:DUF4052 domain-containing protein n=1 Tax=Paenibacillus woosongensis TaxID=307580 RepID=A0A7X2Z494_9BACL|nr:DUF4052 family protein [Paenibacillus woosongensis]MUG47327.1 DUF4052 domain-containing protein [Paenibacillus woosongensis]